MNLSYCSTAWGNPPLPNPNIPPNHDPRQRAFTALPVPYVQPFPSSSGGLDASHMRPPPSLTPGGRPHAPNLHRQDFVFQTPNANHGLDHPSGTFVPPMSMYPLHQQQYNHPAPPVPAPPFPPSPGELYYRPRAMTASPRVLHKPPPVPKSTPNPRPPVPSKMPLYPQSVRSSQPALPPPVPQYPQSIPAAPHLPMPPFTDEKKHWPSDTPNDTPTDMDDLALALALSASEPAHQRELLKKEEEELARALKVSLMLSQDDPSTSTQHYNRHRNEFQNAEAGPSAYLSEPSVVSEAGPSTNASRSDTSEPYFCSQNGTSETQRPPTNRTFQISNDEAFARHLLLQDEQEDVVVQAKAIEAREETRGVLALPPQPAPPRYVDVVLNPPNMSPDTSHSSSPRSPSLVPRPLPTSQSAPPVTLYPTVSMGTIRPAARPSTPASISSSLQRSASSSSTCSTFSAQEQPHAPFATGTSPPASVSGDSSHPLVSPTTCRNPVVSGSDTESSRSFLSLSEASGTGSSSESSTSAPNANQYLDPDLLRGVSVGFTNPSISDSMSIMQGGMPNVISIGFGRCRPFFFQAPTWRHLLKLMARMSMIRIEPTVEAMSLSKIEFKLRTVVQFVRVYHTSSDWRTIVWLTIDHPVPPAAPGASKYTNGDVNVLPWSYTLSVVPALLRDGVDTAMSKAYTIPSTPATPYPSLPINFPNMAMYLQAALDESRRAMHDSTSGMRKLAKMVDMCYPNERYDDNSPEKNTVGGLFKRVIGRSRARGVNEDTYELVTPFVSEDWG